MITGSTFPARSCVCALNFLQNSIMFTPLEPSAGPTGGEGLAAPPLICNLINPAISLAIMIYYLFFFNLNKAQLKQGLPAEDFYHHFQFLLVFNDFFHGSVESVEWSVNYLDCLS